MFFSEAEKNLGDKAVLGPRLGGTSQTASASQCLSGPSVRAVGRTGKTARSAVSRSQIHPPRLGGDSKPLSFHLRGRFRNLSESLHQQQRVYSSVMDSVRLPLAEKFPCVSRFPFRELETASITSVQEEMWGLRLIRPGDGSEVLTHES